MEHIHISKVLEFGFTETHDFKATLWGCSLCDATQDKPFEHEDIEIDHTNCDDDCFGCKVKTLELNTGDANSKKTMSNKKFNSELNAYREARSQGIQPSGTTMTKIEEAYKASENLGKAYKGESMPDASKIDKSLAKTMNELGA